MRLRLAFATTCLLSFFSLAAVSSAAAYAGPDPAFNYAPSSLPAACDAPTSPACVDVSVGFLNQARSNLGQGPYLLPSNFTSLTPDEQSFVLTNLDRIVYGLSPMTGLTAALSADAMGGVQNDTDPHVSDPHFMSWTANWAGGFENLPLAYEAWMYNDGAGSNNLDCTKDNPAGCWGHRHDILSQFDSVGGPLAMGTASGVDSNGDTGFAAVLFQGYPGEYSPTYTYTWAQAVAAGANGGRGLATAAVSTAAAQPVKVTLGHIHQSGRSVTLVARVTGASATVRVAAYSGRRQVMFSVRRQPVLDTFRFQAKLSPGVWRVVVTCHSAALAAEQPRPSVRHVHIP